MKLKIISVALAVCLIVVAAAGLTYAYFTDQQKTTTVFTVGDIYIELTEAAVVNDGRGNMIADPSGERLTGSEAGVNKEHGSIIPGRSIYMDPTVKVTGSENAWIAAKVTLTDGTGALSQLIGYGDEGGHVDIEMLLSGGLLDENVHVDDWNGYENVCYNENYAMVQLADPENGVYTFYFFMLKSMKTNDEVTFYTTLTFPDEWKSAHVSMLSRLEVECEVFGVQEAGFVSCYEAMTVALPEHFKSPIESHTN